MSEHLKTAFNRFFGKLKKNSHVECWIKTIVWKLQRFFFLHHVTQPDGNWSVAGLFSGLDLCCILEHLYIVFSRKMKNMSSFGGKNKVNKKKLFQLKSSICKLRNKSSKKLTGSWVMHPSKIRRAYLKLVSSISCVLHVPLLSHHKWKSVNSPQNFEIP